MASPKEEALARTENLLRDAEEALQQERLAELWRQWGSTVIGMAVMLVVGTGAGVVWRHWQQARHEHSTAALLELLSKKDAVVGPEIEKDMGGSHAAIAYITKAGSLATGADNPDTRKQIETLYAAAAKAGDDTVWEWLARWNMLRLEMDNDKTDPAKLLADYESLAAARKGSELSALVYLDAAIVAGERLKDAAKAVEYATKAENLIQPATPMASALADIKHVYMVRARTTKPENGAQQ